MDPAEALRIERAYRRIRRGMVLLAGAGALAALLWKGWPWCLGFACGAAASIFSFRWLEQATATLAGGGRTRNRAAVLFSLRYLLVGAVGYVIVKIFGLSGLAILCGLLVAAAAVLVEMIYELIHARA